MHNVYTCQRAHGTASRVQRFNVAIATYIEFNTTNSQTVQRNSKKIEAKRNSNVYPLDLSSDI